MQIRPEDFRSAWPHALARMLAQAAEITSRLEQADQKTIDLLVQIPALIEETHGVFSDTKDMQINAHQKLVDSYQQLDEWLMESAKERIQQLKSLEVDLLIRYNVITEEREKLYAMRTELEAREKRLEEFEKLGFFGRLFFKDGKS